MGGTGGLGDGSPPAGSRCRPPGGRVRERSPPKAHSILRISGCQTMHNFAYSARLHEPLVKREKNLGCSACLFGELSSNGNTVFEIRTL